MKIFCKDVSDINREQTPPYSANQSINLWQTTVATDSQIILELKNTLNEEELKRAERFAFEKDKNQFITAHGSLKKILAEYLSVKPTEIQFRKTKNKKPFIVFPITSLKFNISHSENKILIAISDEEIGVDIEFIKPGFEFRNFIKTYFSLKEENIILLSQNPYETFYKFWTRKESVLKAAGIGIIDNLKEIEICSEENESIFDVNYFISSFIIDNCSASIAVANKKTELKYFKF